MEGKYRPLRRARDSGRSDGVRPARTRYDQRHCAVLNCHRPSGGSLTDDRSAGGRLAVSFVVQ